MFPIVILAIENENDRLFMQKLYEDHRRRMFAVAYSVLGERQNIEDVVSEALISLIKKISLIRNLECYVLRTYIVTTTKHAAIDFARKQQRQSKRSLHVDGEFLENIPGELSDMDAEIIRREEVDRIKRSILKLRESDRRVLEMKYLLNLTNEEIAAELNIEAASVHTHLWRVRKRAYAILAEESKDDDE